MDVTLVVKCSSNVNENDNTVHYLKTKFCTKYTSSENVS